MRGLLFLLVFMCLKTQAESFGNNAVLVPKAGVALFDSVLAPKQKLWGLTHQWTVGTTFMQAIDYRWWWMAETNAGFSRPEMPITSFWGSAGLRFNIFDEDFRPHLIFALQYLQFFGLGSKKLDLVGLPIFVGLRPGLGLEWLFYSEMSLSLDTYYGVYFNVNEPVRQAMTSNISFALYF
jgi:hypothetical protein